MILQSLGPPWSQECTFDRMFVVQLEVKLSLKSQTTNAYGSVLLYFLTTLHHCTLEGTNDFDTCSVSILPLSFLLTWKENKWTDIMRATVNNVLCLTCAL